MNLWAYWLLPFLCDWTNLFDLAIVIISIIGWWLSLHMCVIHRWTA